jgi:iron complex outermembrane receptor protein
MAMWGSANRRHSLRRRRRARAGRAVLALGAVFAIATVARAQETTAAPATQPLPDDLTALSLEDLMDVDIMNQQVISVSKHVERVADAPAAVYVITPDEIRRSGKSAIPDLLRLAPGTNVSRINANKWGVSTRGFNDLYSNKLLVLIDGRAVYRPLFAGVYWQSVDYPLGDLDRIEVVRGPGATLWGANAVNGVINITSKDASQTQGWSVGARAGTDDSFASARYGGKLDEETFYRVYGKYRHTAEGALVDGGDANDELDLPQAGFRLDRFATDADTFTLQGDVFHVEAGNTLDLPISFAPPYRVRTRDTDRGTGGNVLARWTHKVSEQSDLSLQLYYDHFEAGDVQLHYRLDTLDLEFQHRFMIDDRHQLVWGAGGRYLADEVNDSELFSFSPESRDDYLFNFFFQDHAVLVPDRLSLFLGSKFEANSYSGLEVQPSARLLWTPDRNNSVWGAVSRAVRTPTRWEEDARIVLERGDFGFGLPASFETAGNGRLKAEELMAYEAGYRTQLTPALSLDVAGFYNRYRRLRTMEPGTPVPDLTATPPHVVVPFTVDNRMNATTYGVEVAATLSVTPYWRLASGYSWLHVDADLHSSSTDPFSEGTVNGSDAAHQFNVRSYLNVGRHLEVNAAAYYVDEVEQYDADAFVRVDASLVWRPTKHVEWSVGVQNAFDPRHPEFGSSASDARAEVERAFYMQLVLTH